MGRYAVLKLGGHVLFKGLELDVEYVKNLMSELRLAAKAYDGLVVVVGGGELARRYVAWGRQLSLNDSSLDVVGIRVARVNASLLWAAYHGVAPPEVPSSISEAVTLVPSWKVVFMGGLQPAQSTTTVAALVAEALGAERLVIATDVDGVYDSDPKLNPRARKLDTVTVAKLEEMFRGGVRAGGYRLFDPLTLAIIKRSCIATQVVCGRPPSNVRRALAGERIGTLVVA
ncbi:MAG: UMP kinase [Thermoprotei archaeon]|nr:MAG: UMP kinase [Thermoprotei archaeon]RLE98372.1 MAG: UMP kinase [Thermoprotei archaeon]